MPPNHRRVVVEVKVLGREGGRDQRCTGRTMTDVAFGADSTHTSAPRATGTAQRAANFAG